MYLRQPGFSPSQSSTTGASNNAAPPHQRQPPHKQHGWLAVLAVAARPSPARYARRATRMPGINHANPSTERHRLQTGLICSSRPPAQCTTPNASSRGVSWPADMVACGHGGLRRLCRAANMIVCIGTWPSQIPSLYSIVSVYCIRSSCAR